MPWLETIEIRSLKTCCSSWLASIYSAVLEIARVNPSVSVAIFRNASIETDLLIELKHHSEEVEIEGSSAGVKLASVCTTHGMVNHNIWLEDSGFVNPKNQIQNPNTN